MRKRIRNVIIQAFHDNLEESIKKVFDCKSIECIFKEDTESYDYILITKKIPNMKFIEKIPKRFKENIEFIGVQLIRTFKGGSCTKVYPVKTHDKAIELAYILRNTYEVIKKETISLFFLKTYAYAKNSIKVSWFDIQDHIGPILSYLEENGLIPNSSRKYSYLDELGEWNSDSSFFIFKPKNTIKAKNMKNETQIKAIINMKD